MQRAFTSIIFSTLSLATLSCLIPLTAKAQVNPDGTTSTTVNQDGNNFTIEQGDRVGDNLFHSFNEFSVPTLGSAAFNNASDIANIFSRVTGSNISFIDGLISANGAANLFLINPNGIIFGENARLNLGGSFFASTADSLLFEGNTEFSATNPKAPPLLEVSIPIGLNFRDNPGDIVNRSFVQNSIGDFVGLEVAPGENLTLVGGNINFEAGEATAKGGNIQLGGLSEAGTVTFNDDGSLNFPENVAQADITLSNFADVDVRGTGGGNIAINARNLNLEAGDFSGSLIRAGIAGNSGFDGAQAGDININATGAVNLSGDSSIQNQVDEGATGNSGDINVNTRSLTLTEGTFFSSSIFGQGNGGSVTINASQSVSLNDGNIFSQVSSDAVGNAGGVEINTENLTLTNGGQINSATFGQGDAGTVAINASQAILVDGEDFDGFNSAIFGTVGSGAKGNVGLVEITPDNPRLDEVTTGDVGLVEITIGNAGAIEITTGSLNLTNGGRVSASTFGQGNAGLVEISASDTITIDGESSAGFLSEVSSSVTEEAEGDAGGVTIDTGSLSLTNGGRVDADTFGRGNAGSVEISASDTITIDGESSAGFLSEVSSSVTEEAEGDAGGVTIDTGSLSLTNGGQISTSTFGRGNAGSVEINALDTITINGEDSEGFASGVNSQVNPEAEGDAGGVSINTGSLNLTNGGRVDASTFGRGNAGSVEINATDTITIDGESSAGFLSGASSQVFSGAVGDAGGVTIITGSLSLTNGGQISTSTFGRGNAGSVEINALDTITINGEDSEGFASNASSSVEEEAVGNAGGVSINTGSLNLTNGGRVDASTLGQGNGGDVTVNARESIEISGAIERFRSGISAEALIGNGNGGDVNVFTNRLIIDDGGTIEAGNFDSLGVFAPGTGKPGNINIQANSLSLSNQASIEATTQSEIGEAANINLTLAEDLIFKNNSLISARAFGNANGGNITINANNGSLVAFPNQNNDIIANAEQGNGGNINITTQGIFGLEERPENPFTNDIDASSSFGLLESQGKISVTTPEFQPTSSFIELPEDVVDASDQISQNPCERGVGGEFIITGKGGLRPNPHETLSSDRVQVALVEPVPSRQGDGETGRLGDWETRSPETPTPEAVPAQGWIFNDRGEVMLTSYIPSGMAEVTPANPLVQTPTNPSQLATQAEKLYQNQEFEEAATLWSQAAQAFAVSGDNLNQAMALSNLSLTNQHLGKWENANQAIQNSLTLLNVAPENSRLVAQTLDIQGKLQRETVQPAAAIDTWQKAANIYQKLDKSVVLTQNNLNQAQALQDLGLYTRACQIILASLKMENIASCKDLDGLTTEELERQLDKITAQPSLLKVWGLRKLGDLLLVIGQPQKSSQILATSLTLAKKVNSPSEISATYLSLGKNAHSLTKKEAEPIRNKRRNNQQQALEAYRQAIAISPDLITQQQARLNKLSLLIQIKEWSEAASLSQEILTQFDKLPPGHSNVFAQINFAHILVELLDRDKFQPPGDLEFPGVSELDRILANVTKNAQILGDNRLEAYALGDRGRLYELTGQLALAEQYTQQAIALISTLDSADIASQYFWQLGRIQNRQGELEKAIAAYTKAYNALQSLRLDLVIINPEVQFSFRDRVEPVYRELVALNFKYYNQKKAENKEESTAKLIQARDVMESLQVEQLKNFFREACIVGNPQPIDEIDPNAAIIYTIVLSDQLGILLSLPNKAPILYTVDVTQEEISQVVDTMRSSLQTPVIPVAESLPKYQKIYNWLIRPLEAELVKNQVKTIAFVLDADLRNIPMAVLHDGQQYLVEKYALALTPGLQLLDSKPLTAIEVNVTLAGLSKNQDKSSSLPGVEAELQDIQEIGLTDRYLLNEQFTKQALKQNIVNSNSTIVHLATRAQFSPKAGDTFIQAWDERINLKELADLLRDATFKRKNAIELLVLSAGETATGDSRGLGLAGVAVQAGVRSTLATVWPVADRSTVMIMEQFYLQLMQAGKNQFNKAEALRQAQLALIKDKQFNHPHYWAPFILIGNWQ